MSKKCEICGKWLKNLRGYNTHYRMMHQKITNNIEFGVILNRIRKLELDNSFMKHQLKHKTFNSKNSKNSKDLELDWDIPEEVKVVKNVYKIEFNVVIKELRFVLNKESILEKDFRFNNDEIGFKTPEEIIQILN